MSDPPELLQPSALGTKEYWDELYARELANQAENAADRGTVWFDDVDAEARLLGFLAARPALGRADTAFLDVGCGNGSLLGVLRADGWRGHMLGVDYSAASVALARRVAAPASAPPVHFAEWDVLAGDPAVVLTGLQRAGWDVVLDKGTFDAVSLSLTPDACRHYRDRLLPLLRPGGLFLITSCNWTEDELRAWFEFDAQPDYGRASVVQAGSHFVLDGRIPYRTFSFGGVKGQAISSLCFRKVERSSNSSS